MSDYWEYRRKVKTKTEKQLEEIKAEIWNKHYATRESFDKGMDKFYRKAKEEFNKKVEKLKEFVNDNSKNMLLHYDLIMEEIDKILTSEKEQNHSPQNKNTQNSG